MTVKRPTARDVAALAGVSVATVSYVLNGRGEGRVGQDAANRVLEAARRLAYAPNSSARSLRRRRTERVCLVVGAIGVPSNDQISRDVHRAADQAGLGVITIVVDSEARGRQAIDLLHQRIADGAIVAPSVPHISNAALDALARSNLPLVVMSNTVRPAGFDVVRTPEREACAEALDHLVATGRGRIAYMAHDASQDPDEPLERTTAYYQALDRHGMALRQELVVPGANDRVTAYRATADLLRLDDPPDAIFAASDRAAISAIWALRDAGRRVPDDVAVIGVGNLEEGLISTPQLTTVGDPAQDYTEPARLLFDRLLASEALPDREITTTWSVIHRGSA